MKRADPHTIGPKRTFYLEKGCCGEEDCKLTELEPGFYHWTDNPVLELCELVWHPMTREDGVIAPIQEYLALDTDGR